MEPIARFGFPGERGELAFFLWGFKSRAVSCNLLASSLFLLSIFRKRRRPAALTPQVSFVPAQLNQNEVTVFRDRIFASRMARQLNSDFASETVGEERQRGGNMSASSNGPQVFISHSSKDTWVARQIADRISACGAGTFLDEADVAYGDDFDDKIIAAADHSIELLVLLTPWALTRPYIWIEIGLFLNERKRIVVVLHGLTAKEISTDERIPAILKRIDLVEINQLDRYFHQLKKRVIEREKADV